MASSELQSGLLLKRAPFLVVRRLSGKETRVYSKLHGNLTSFDFDIDEVLHRFDTPVTMEEAARTMPRALIEGLYEKGFLIDGGRNGDDLLAEAAARAQWKNEVPSVSKVTFLVSGRCNLACRECYHHFYDFRSADMTPEFAFGILDGLFPYLREGQVPELLISFLGYEPLLNFETLRKVYDRASAMGEEYGIATFFKIYTNAFALADHLHGWIRDHRSNLGVIVSLDGVKEDNDRTRIDFSGKGTYDRIMENLTRFMAAGVECAVLTVLSRLNFARIERFVDEMAAMGVKRIFANLYYGQTDEERLMELTEGEKFEALRRMDQTTEQYGIEFGGEWKFAVARMVTGSHFFCPAGRKQLVFSADGVVYPCQRFAGTKLNFGTYGKDFWDELRHGGCGPYNDWARDLDRGLEERMERKSPDLTGCSCPFLPFVRGEEIGRNLEEELNDYLLEYYVTRPLERIVTRSPMNL